MKKGELIFNFSLGVSVLVSGFIGLHLMLQVEFSIVRLATFALNLCVGLLFIIRKRVVKSGSVKSILISFPSFILGGLLFKMAHPFSNWTHLNNLLFILFTLLACISFIYLGKNFSVFPNLRAISIKGPYRFIRHPCYVSEIGLISCCCAANCSFISISLLILFIYCIILRIKEEEQLLMYDNDYLKYKMNVKWRLIPHIW